MRVRGQAVEMTLSVPEGPVALDAMLPVFRIMTDHFVEAAGAAEAKAGRTVSCGARCDACCRQLIPLTEPEARRLADLVKQMPEPRRTAVRNRFSALQAALQAEGLLQILYNRETLDKTALHDLGMRYLALEAECPFLEDKNCSIHSERPLACREHLVTSPPELCRNPAAATISKVPMPASIFGAAANLQRSEKMPTAPFVPLPLALEWKGNTERKRRGTEWLQGVMEGLSGKKEPKAE